MSYHGFRERWDRAAAQLRWEHSMDGFLKMREDGEVSAQELFALAYQQWYDHPESRELFLSGLMDHRNTDIQEFAEKLLAFVARRY